MNEDSRLPDPPEQQDFDGTATSAIYTTTVTVTGGATEHGRASGKARSADEDLDLDLRMPTELGGDGQGTNPEQLFAAGLAASLHAALSLVARQAALATAGIAVAATVALGPDPRDGGYLLHVDLVVEWPGIPRETAAPMLKKAEALCPYARMARRGTPMTIALAP
ncbi:Ohr family peroxiredoxin [Streptomyces sp. NPDC005917]|uniref:Ohr family peroxiredoxin n=1 Tax=unclassified Streptomyces TaxID=2593676 RepID=UPI0033CDEBF1